MRGKGAYLFLGPEEGEKAGAVQKIREQLVSSGKELEDYNYFAFETSVSEIVSLLRNGSLFGTHLFIRFRSAELIKKKEDIDLLSALLASPLESGTLVFESTSVRVDKRIETLVGSSGKQIFWEMFDNQKEGWIRGYVRRHGSTIDDEAIELLLDLVDNNTQELRTEIDKLIAFVGKDIGVQDVEHHVYHAREENVFTLFDALAVGTLTQTLDILLAMSAVVDSGRIVSGLLRQFERLFLIHRLKRQGIEEGRLFSMKGVEIRSKRAQKSYGAATRRFNLATTRRILMLLTEAEALLRSTASALHVGILQQVIYSLVEREARWLPSRREA